MSSGSPPDRGAATVLIGPIERPRRRLLPAASFSSFDVRVALVWIVLLGGIVVAYAHFDLDAAIVWDKLPYLLGLKLAPDGLVQGAAMTLFITVVSAVFAAMIGIATALGRLSRHPVAFGVATFYASLFRGTPLLIQVLIIYLALPQIGIVLGAITSGVVALSLNYGAYFAETVRTGILSVPRGQSEAARSLGLSRRLVGLKIVAPQAIRIIIPPAGTQLVSMLKDSSLVSIMGIWELNFLAQSYGRASFRYLELLTTAAVIYWVLSILLELVQARLERRYGKGFADVARGRPR